ncbi:MAG: alpha/beta hydrolase [Sphingomonas phyllosphaerae]|uniref:alpha/beta fold hydrolase n=1 Tax=Sphingomonas phyllosphaerae TaxID=257003 RepID=UPI002FF4AFC5
MSEIELPSRRGILGLGAVGVIAAAAGPSFADAARSVPAPLKTFEARSSDGTVLHGESVGDDGAPEILFVHGLRQSRLSWSRQYDDPGLAGFRKVRFDLRGHGDSDKPSDPASYADMTRWADDIAVVMEAAKLRRPVLVGWSLGGFVTGAYLGKYGDAKVAGINLVDAVTKLSPDLLTPLAGRYAASTSSHDLGERTAETASFLLACFHQPPAGADLQQMLVVNGMTARAVNEGFTRTATPDMEPVFARYRKPLLVTHGIHDRLVRLAMSERIQAQRHDVRLSIFDISGHSPFYEESRRFNRELAAFVTSAARG